MRHNKNYGIDGAFNLDSSWLNGASFLINIDNNVSAVHAELECGTFKALKPELDMISIGPDLKDGHTIKETLYLSSIPKVWYLLEGILEDYPELEISRYAKKKNLINSEKN